jgi:anti-sigma factor RsiW
MTDMAHHTDEELTAFLDGEAEAEVMRAISLAVEQDQNLASRLDDLRHAETLIRAPFEALLTHAPQIPASLVTPAPSSFGWREMAAGLVVGALLMSGAALWLRPKEPGWQDKIATYQALYTADTLASLDHDEASVTAQLQSLSSLINLDLSNVRDGQTMTLKRGQMLGLNGKNLVQLAFLTSSGDPVALCIIHNGKPGTKPFQPKQLQGMQAVSWARDGYGFLLIGGQDSDAVITAAKQFNETL